MGISDVLLNNVKMEYLFVGGTFALFLLITVIALISASGDKKGWSGFGLIVILVYLRIAVTAAAGLFSCVVNPIRILISYRHEYQSVMPLLTRLGLYALTALPILLYIAFVILTFWGNAIGNYFFEKKYETGKGAYEVAPENYKTVREFRDELMDRGFFFREEDEELLKKKNAGYSGADLAVRAPYYYSRATIMPLPEHRFLDDVKQNEILSPDGEEKYPAYIYNAILVLDEEEKTFQYAPLGRYERNDRAGSERQNPFFQDYYIECKILYVDGKTYAIIGVSQSFNVRMAFEYSDKPYEKPFYVVLSETENITTYFKGKYYPNGAIENFDDFKMKPNTEVFDDRSPFRPINYPVRVVERLDVNAINAIAREFQEGILKESIEYHFRKINYKTPRDMIGILDRLNLTEENAEGFQLTQDMNERFQPYQNEKNTEYYYTKAILMPMRDDPYKDTWKQDKFFRHPVDITAPIYVYNAILTLPGQGEKLRYAPFARYGAEKGMQPESLSDGQNKTDFPYYLDYYVECKIVCVDESIYAIIGIGACQAVDEFFHDSGVLKPYYVILSEKETITTCVRGKYYPNGAIKAVDGGFVMLPEKSDRDCYPIRVVDHLDADSISAFAETLQNGILKESVEAYFERSKTQFE